MTANASQNTIQSVVVKTLIEGEIILASKALRSLKTADVEVAALRDKWAKPENLRAVIAGAFGRILKKLKGMLPEQVLKSWSKVRGALGKFVGIFKNPKAVKELSKMIGEITPDAIKDFLKSGAKAARKVFEQIKMVLVTPSDIPTLTDLIKRTAVGAQISEWFQDNVKPRADIVDQFLKKHVPTLRRVAVAAIFTFIWLNVDELSWEMSSLVDGFTGNLSLSELLATLPESAIGAVSGALFGIGYTIMPYMLLGRLLWMVGKKYLKWDGSKFVVNWQLVDKTLFKNAPQYPQYRALRI